MAAHEGFHVT